MNTSATITLFFDQRRAKKDNRYPIKISVYYQGEKRRYNTIYSAVPAEWIKVNGARLKDTSLKDLKAKLDKVKQDSLAIINSMEEFDFDSFEKQFLASSKGISTKRGLVELYNEIINTCRKNGNEGSARAYQDSLNAFIRFKKNLSFKDVTADFLNAFEKDFLKKGKSLTSVGIYARQLRAVFNEAINRGLIKKETYPFSRYKIPGGYNKKKSLSKKEIATVFSFQSESPLENEAISFWKLAYLCSGMNIGDILRLKDENLHDKFLLFNRSKTINTKKTEQKPIQVPLNDEAKALIKRLRVANSSKTEDFIFAILNGQMTPIEEKNAIKAFNRKINQQLEKIAERLELSGRLSNMTARHSFATMLKRQNESIEMIGELLGHSNVKTTQNYLASFTDDSLLNVSKKLLDFN